VIGAEAERWIRAHVDPVASIETVHERPWSTVSRVPVAGGTVWFKACAPVQAFEPRLSVELSARWPDRVAEVVAYDETRAWLLLADAGSPIGIENNRPEDWLAALPPYGELQCGEAQHALDHLAHGVPDLRVASLPARYDDLLGHDLPLDADEIRRLRDFVPRLAELGVELAGIGITETVQHDDLHAGNLYGRGGRLRVLDWGDCSISHPFASLVVTFRFLEETNGLLPDDPWFARLRDAYLEPWGPGLADAFAIAIRVGTIAHACAWARQRDLLAEEGPADRWFAVILRRAVAATVD
jgi:Phosphotransferase enzyme family